MSVTGTVFDYAHRDSINNEGIYSYCLCAVSIALLTVVSTDSSTQHHTVKDNVLQTE